MNPKHIRDIVDHHEGGTREGIISLLEEIQANYNYLPEEALKIVAEMTDRSLVDIYGVATFYRAFSLKPRGKHLVSICLGTACHVRGGLRIAEEFERQLGISTGETTKDNEITLETVNCLGACALGPIVTVDGHYFSNVTVHEVKEIIQKIKEGLDKVDIHTDERIFPLEVACPRCNHSLMDPQHHIDGYPSVRLTVSFLNTHGWVRLSSLYGSYSVETQYNIPDGAVANFFCPHCHAELKSIFPCMNCNSQMVPMSIPSGGMVQICSRRGCKGHLLDINATPLD